MLYFKYTDLSATYQSSPRKTAYHFKRNAIKKRTVLIVKQPKTKWYRLYPSLAQIETTMHAPALVQQFTHLVHPNRSHRLLYLLRKIADMTENTTIESRQTCGKTSKQYIMRQDIPLFRKLMFLLLISPGQTACFARLTVLSSLAVAASSVVS